MAEYAYFKTRGMDLVRCTAHPDGSVEMKGIGTIPSDYAQAEVIVLRPVAIEIETCPSQANAVALGGGSGRDPVAYDACGGCEDCRKAGFMHPLIAVWDRERGETRAATWAERAAHRIASRRGDSEYEKAVTSRHLPPDPRDLTPEVVSLEAARVQALDALGEPELAESTWANLLRTVLEGIAGGAAAPAELATCIVGKTRRRP